MAYRSYDAREKDTGWGLIYRLNRLLDGMENACALGSWDKWNLLMDRVFVNIIYKNPAEIIKDADGNIIDVKLTHEDVHVFRALNKKIRDCKKDLLLQKKSGNSEQVHIINARLYNIYMTKDAWLKKTMFRMNIYLTDVNAKDKIW